MRTLYGRTNMNPMSRFIKEIPEDLIQGMEEANESIFGSFSQSTPKAKPKIPAPRRKARKIQQKQTTGAENSEWAPGDKAKHGIWGIGTVVNVKNEGEATELDIADRKSTRLNSSHDSISY